MPGSYTFRPIEAKLTHDTELIGKMSPYCTFQLGENTVKSAICKKGGKNPHWEDLVTISAPTSSDSIVNVQVMDQNTFTSGDLVGSFSLDLSELQSKGASSKWFPLFYEDKPAGELLLESSFEGGMIASTSKTADFDERLATTQTSVSGLEPEVRVFHEQKQVVEPRTFVKEIDVVETRPVTQDIEVMESVKVLKDVEYTEVVPVTKTIETIEPQVVKKEIEVIEPQLVTKTIQVVENVPVMKEVEVIESVPVMKEVETFEPQTFTKQVEVTEQVPVTKQVTVTEPVHLKKTVEYVEDVITTKTITKEIREPVIVNEESSTYVGPASLLHKKDKKFMGSELLREDRDITGSDWIREDKDILRSDLLREDKDILGSDLLRKDKDIAGSDLLKEDRI